MTFLKKIRNLSLPEHFPYYEEGESHKNRTRVILSIQIIISEQ